MISLEQIAMSRSPATYGLSYPGPQTVQVVYSHNYKIGMNKFPKATDTVKEVKAHRLTF
jgi:hypothetical protein